MKKQLLTAIAALTFGAGVAQVSPNWTITQNASFSITSAGVRFLDAVDPNVVWLTGYDGAAPGLNYNWYSRTINGGTSYNSGNIFSDTNTYVLANIDGIDANTAWVSAFKKSVQGEGVIYRTTNGGSSWTDMTAPGMFSNAASFADVVTFLTPNNGIVLGDPVGGEFELWTTTNGGTSWTAVPGVNIPNPLTGEYGIVNLFDKQGTTNMWFGTNKGRVYYTTNAGSTWNVSSLTTTPNTSTVTEVAFTNATNGLAYVATGPAASPVMQVYSTTDGGVTWALTTSNDPDMGLNDMCGIPGTGFFASVGAGQNNTTISYSTDNGLSWTSWGGTATQYLNIDFVDAINGWAGSFSDLNTATLGGIFKFAGVNASFSAPINVCRTGATVTVSPVNQSTGSSLTYSWSAVQNSVVFSSVTASVPVITFSANGAYIIKLTATNNLGVAMTTSQTINVLTCTTPTANFSVSGGTLICNNTAFTLVNSSTGTPAPNFTVSAAQGGTLLSSASGPSTVSVKFAAPGVYTISSTASNIFGSGTTVKTITVTDCSPVAGIEIDSLMMTPSPTFVAMGNFMCTTGSAATSSILAKSISVGTGMTFNWTITAPPTAIGPGAPVVVLGPQNGRKITFSPAGGIGLYTITLVASNVSGSDTAMTIFDFASCIVGIQQYSSLQNNLTVYPNPAHEQLNVQLPATGDVYKLKMINIIGAVVYEEQSSKNLSINLANKPKGVYFLSVENGTDKVVKKIVVE